MMKIRKITVWTKYFYMYKPTYSGWEAILYKMTKFVISIIGYPRQLAEMKSNFWSTSCHRILRIKASEVIKSVCASHIGQKWENSAINTSGCMITSKAKINAVWNIFNHSAGLLEVTLISSQFIFFKRCRIDLYVTLPLLFQILFPC